jgi:hypothetical protein
MCITSGGTAFSIQSKISQNSRLLSCNKFRVIPHGNNRDCPYLIVPILFNLTPDPQSPAPNPMYLGMTILTPMLFGS